MGKLQNLLIEQSSKTPQIDLNQLNGELILSGKSIPENSAKVYEPVFKWVLDYVMHPRPITNLRINLEYFNTSSSLWLAKIFKVLARINKPDYVLFIHLYIDIEDYDDIKEFGDLKETFAFLSDLSSGTSVSIGIKLYGTDDDGIIKETSIFI